MNTMHPLTPPSGVARSSPPASARSNLSSDPAASAGPVVKTFAGCRLELRQSKHESFLEFHVTGTVEATGDPLAAADALLEQVAAVLAERKIETLQEKLFGLSRLREDVMRRRDRAYQRAGVDSSVPITWIQGVPLLGCDFVGIQIWGLATRNGARCVQTVENSATGRGRLWTGRGFRMLYLPSVRGTTPDGVLCEGHTRQAEQMFSNVGEGLGAHKFDYRDVTRTWIYLDRLLDWYGELNRVRTAHYRKVGLGAPGSVAFPASTGIQGRSGQEECLVDVLAMQTENTNRAAAIPVTRSPRQDQSFNYGSAFSRGMIFDIEGRRTVSVSGTASINTAGQSTHIGDAECQSLETLMSIAAILEEQGGSLRNIASATLYCKDRAAWDAWNRVTRLLQVPLFPKVCILTDVCRDNLLVEMEAFAVI